MNDTVHPASEFGKLDWSKLDPEMCTRSWSYGYGGHGLPDSTMTINDIDPETFDAEIWELPLPLQRLVEMHAEIAVDTIRGKMRAVMGAARAPE